ncbi:MAG: hypothetical protein HZB37_07125, partial [Planctomycetes bacterium]|nr:hypothetical protein [Planctomycetota bacterium]
MMRVVCLLCLFFMSASHTRTVATANNTDTKTVAEFMSAITEDADAGWLKGDKELPPLSTSCTDRCHVNYKGYRTIYQEKIFRHRSHLPEQGLQCDRCHSSDAVGTETHGRIIIENKDCCKCHHKKNEICMQCHAVVKDYRDGIIKNSSVRKAPDWMSRSVSCTDCHKVDTERNAFMPVRDYCVECHNSDYGLLYDAWKDLFQERTGQTTNDGTSTPFYMKQIQKYGMHNFRLSK